MVRKDLDLPGSEAIQVRVEFAPGFAFPARQAARASAVTRCPRPAKSMPKSSTRPPRLHAGTERDARPVVDVDMTPQSSELARALSGATGLFHLWIGVSLGVAAVILVIGLV